MKITGKTTGLIENMQLIFDSTYVTFGVAMATLKIDISNLRGG